MGGKIYGTKTVWQAALDRIDYLFDEFENLIVNFSGGKDSTVVLNLCLIVAERKNRLPLPVMFVDQEAEWDCTIEYVRKVMSDPRIRPIWMQVPFRIFNAASQRQEWLHAWEPGESGNWIRQKEEIAIKKNPTTADRFGDLLDATATWFFEGKPHCCLTGVRCEESTARYQGMTAFLTYKWLTWGKVKNKKRQEYIFCPIYDWSYTDIWKAIHDNSWDYCKLYDFMYQYGTPVREMRVSNVTHETAVSALQIIQEIEGDLWQRLTKRVKGVNTVGRLGKDWKAPSVLPYMFDSWKEYRDHLLNNLVSNADHQATMRRHMEADERLYAEEIHDKLVKMHIDMILKNDYFCTKRDTFSAANGRFLKSYQLKQKELGGATHPKIN